VTSAIQTQLNSKQATVTGALTPFLTSNASNSVVVVTNASGKMTTSATTVTELSYVSGVTSAIQTQLNALNIWSTASNGNAYFNKNVGIGTSAPTAPLTVNGTALASTYQLSGSGTASAPGFSFSNNSNMGMYSPATSTLAFSTLGLERARFSSNGYLGVGTTPTAPLEVVSGASVASMGSSLYFNSTTGSALVSSANYTSTVSIVSNSSVWVKNGWSFVASSDHRIKKNTTPADLSNVAAIFDNINLYTYSYIDATDTPPGTPNTVHGFIAQEVNQYFPEAITVTREAIPNVYAMASASSSSLAPATLTLTLPSTVSLSNLTTPVNVGDTLQYLLSNSDAPVKATVLGIQDDRTLVVDAVDPRGAATGAEGGDVFVYGTYVSDFLTLDKNKLLGLCYGKVKQLTGQVMALEAHTMALEAQMEAMMVALSNIKAS
jgi:hypothetical protein